MGVTAARFSWGWVRPVAPTALVPWALSWPRVGAGLLPPPVKGRVLDLLPAEPGAGWGLPSGSGFLGTPSCFFVFEQGPLNIRHPQRASWAGAVTRRLPCALDTQAGRVGAQPLGHGVKPLQHQFSSVVLFTHSCTHPLTCGLRRLFARRLHGLQRQAYSRSCALRKVESVCCPLGESRLVSSERAEEKETSVGATASAGPAAVGWLGRGGLSEKCSHGSSVLGRGVSPCKGPEVGMSLSHLIHGNKIGVVGGSETGRASHVGLWGGGGGPGPASQGRYQVSCAERCWGPGWRLREPKNPQGIGPCLGAGGGPWGEPGEEQVVAGWC